MLEKYEWIATERRFFGQPNTAYDFDATNMKEVFRRLAKMQEQKVLLFHVICCSLTCNNFIIGF